jgi:RimJ/RimL family protein N-acetyltransferase
MEMKEVVLETERLRLRWFREDDFADFCDICAEPEVMHFLGDGQPMMPMEVWKQMATFMGHWFFRGYGIWAVEERQTAGWWGELVL